MEAETRKAKRTAEKKVKADNSEKFCEGKHKIKNSSITGLIPLWIPTDRMYVYYKPGKDPAKILEKYANRVKVY